MLGYGVDDSFQLETDTLRPLEIRLGEPAQAADGSAATLTSFSINADGRIVGRFSDGMARDLGQIRVARFAKASGQAQQGGNTLTAGPNSGAPVEGSPGQSGTAEIVAGATELSRTDVGHELVGLFEAWTMLRASVMVIGTADAMLEELVNLRRWY